MKNIKFIHSFVLSILLLSSCQSYGSNMKASYIEQLHAISKVDGNGSNKLYALIRESALELQKDWSPELAKELARVFNEILNVNDNYFLAELIEPVTKGRAKEFMPILDKALSDKNKKVYKEMVKMGERENTNGNG